MTPLIRRGERTRKQLLASVRQQQLDRAHLVIHTGRQLQSLIRHVAQITHPDQIASLLEAHGIAFKRETRAWADGFQQKYIYTGEESHRIELRLHLKPDGIRMTNFRFGLQLYQPCFPQAPVAGRPWVPHPSDTPNLRAVDQGLIEHFGPATKSKYTPLPGSWAETAEYVDAAGWVYYNAEGLLSGLITDAAHIKPARLNPKSEPDNDRTFSASAKPVKQFLADRLAFPVEKY